MHVQEIKRLADCILQDTPRDEAYLSISQYGGGLDECSISANGDGLRLLARELLLASLQVDEELASGKRNVVLFGQNVDDWWHGEVLIDHVVPVNKQEAVEHQKTHLPTLRDRIAAFGCAILVLMVCALVVIGFVAVVQFVVNMLAS